ncbi:polysaccharide pyruvyl transferase family protein [Pararcticibacter amylolyticus]|uniref:Polysaccharide pyruvyl transferase family protein n=1 Tax=Pararcticibacter amylolyticus TaxID=2173175 RepID=A0A2U2PBE8_9SPHI|nr:polysaccharide pyruvyl transferase family protein [Pararcticibacter amylolyticus]PWG78726.1 polysaccharide pyruvyl transferase family protein [Pararcticibacter amylolyticus]
MNSEQMKNGVLVYMPGYGEQNIGDYVQSLAALQFLGNKPDVYLHREHLNSYSGDKVKLIMNGWFTHKPENWPPSEKIQPLFVSFHVNSLAKNTLLREAGVEYLKKHQPIGCRDKGTVDLLREKGVDAYFTGCLTLTLGETYATKETDGKVYMVDPIFDKPKDFGSLSKALIGVVTRYSKIKKLAHKLLRDTSIKSLLIASRFYDAYSEYFSDSILMEAEYIHHYFPESQFKNEEEKFDLAKSLLRKYSKAALVVTSRIHCALPSLGMNTPVVYVNDLGQDEASSCRLDGITELFNVIDYKKGKLFPRFSWEGGSKIVPSTKVTNKPNYLSLKEKLVEKCRSFGSLN